MDFWFPMISTARLPTTLPKNAMSSQGAFMTEAIEVMRKFSIDELPVVGDDDVLCGLIDIQDLLARGFSLMNTP